MKKLLLYNAKIYIGKNQFEEAVYVEDEIIKKVGKSEALLSLCDDSVEQLDLEGRVVLPGLNDSHMHFLNIGYNAYQLYLGETKSIDEALELCKKYIEEHNIPEGRWVQCYGWNDDNWTDKRNMTRYDLDKVSEKHPIMAVRICGHVTSVNSYALKEMNINKEEPQPKEGTFLVDEDGEPTGVLFEMIYRIFRAMPDPTVEEIKDMILMAAKEAVESGLTEVQTDDFESIPGHNFSNILQAYRELSEEGRLPLRVYHQCALPNMERFNLFLEKGFKTHTGDGMYGIGPLKLFGDGSLGARTAWLKDEYSDDPGTLGFGIFDNDAEIDELVEEAHKRGMSVAVHCIGDAAIEQSVAAIEKAMAKYPEIENRHGIVHAQILNQDLMDRMKKANIIAYIQPIFIEYDLHMAESRIGKERMATSYNWKTLYDMGIKVPFGTDCPVESHKPMLNIYSAVTRKDLECKPEGGWYKEEALSLDEAIECYTEQSAYASYCEDKKGRIAEGMLADMTVLEQDIFEIEEGKIKDIEIAMTIVNGDIKYRNV